MGLQPNCFHRHRGLIRAAQKCSSLNGLIAVGLVLTLTSPTYAGRNVFGAGGASPGNRDAVRAQAYADSQANALRVQAAAPTGLPAGRLPTTGSAAGHSR